LRSEPKYSLIIDPSYYAPPNLWCHGMAAKNAYMRDLIEGDFGSDHSSLRSQNAPNCSDLGLLRASYADRLQSNPIIFIAAFQSGSADRVGQIGARFISA
jgi:hypothetical protein